MNTFRTKVTAPAATRWNYVTHQYDVIREAFEITVEVSLDVDKVARTMGVKAAQSKNRKSIDAGGALVVKAIGHRPTAAPITDEHRYPGSRT